jgi:hypothetical protein
MASVCASFCRPTYIAPRKYAIGAPYPIIGALQARPQLEIQNFLIFFLCIKLKKII